MTSLLPPHTTAHVFLRSEAIAAGYNDREIRSLVRAGVWHRVRRGAYVDAATWHALDDVQQHGVLGLAVILQARTDVVLSHVSALPYLVTPMWDLPKDVVHVTRLDRRAGRKEAGVQQHRGRLEEGDVVERNGRSVTSPTRTALDITTVAGTEQALCVVNHLLHTKDTTPEELRGRYRTMERDPFTLRTDLVLRLADPRIESVGETRTFFMCWQHGVPAPEPQWLLRDETGHVVARLDFAWPEHGVWLEFDGREKYVKYLREGETVTEAVLREKAREDLIRERTGWRCIRITWADLAHPDRTTARILKMLAS